ncbi:mechanosensitive ion channel family protein [Arsukibacterium sp.]|uniref:mechanosensitive ion channel family protein n=1 Tax=Arsukibacterium sp. TaxID=1977258 RepID=UPI00299DA84D|nr:mechanosensitive ion channel domain-containing protein [Arsukibacterium sp.]MDX1678588.1 mechanosensitive ion channel [Arsukibacterium sp.]
MPRLSITLTLSCKTSGHAPAGLLCRDDLLDYQETGNHWVGKMMEQLIRDGLVQWATAAIQASVAMLVAFGFYKGLVLLIARLFKPESATRIFFNASARALGTTLVLIALYSVLNSVPEDLPLLAPVQHITKLLLIMSLSWTAVSFTSAIGDVIVMLNPAFENEWKHARKVETQTRFFVRGLNIVIVLVGVGAALMTFENVSTVGSSLLASAGIGGIILGFAARPVLSNLLAGMQIAITQPFRIDDAMYVQGEWCWVEEVTATYVVLRVWDLRRLIVPLQWFIENPFQNWSRNTSDQTGSALIWVDYGIPVAALRHEFSRLLQATPDWDGVTQSVQVVEAGEKAMQIRFLLSARNSSTLWNLRCYVREGMIDFIQQHYPDYLPKHRAELTGTTVPAKELQDSKT